MRTEDPPVSHSVLVGAGGGNRTLTTLRSRDFESRASASFTTPAFAIPSALASARQAGLWIWTQNTPRTIAPAQMRTRTTEMPTRTAEMATRTAEMPTRTTEMATRTTEMATRTTEIPTRTAEMPPRT